ncbi:MAG: alpha/beta fold hydrolase [bacterium]
MQIPSELKKLYPFSSNFLELGGGLKYHYLDEGAGECLVMLHGNPTWSFYYRNLILGLRDRYRLVAPDHIGCGLSDKPGQYDYRLSRHIDNLELLINKLQLKKVTLVMHDWGGAIGMGWAVRHPESVKRLVIFNTAAFLLPRIHILLRICRIPVLGALAIRGFNAFARAAVYLACRKHERMTPPVRRGYLAPYPSYADRVAHLRFVQDIPTKPGHPSYDQMKTIEKGLRQFKNLPVRIFWGEKDFVFDEHFLNRWLDFFPRAEVTRFPAAGHYVVEDAGEEILPLLKDFIK